MDIQKTNDIYYFKKDIRKFQDLKKPFQIYIDFNYCNDIDDKITIIDLIDELELNDKVGILEIVVKENNPVN